MKFDEDEIELIYKILGLCLNNEPLIEKINPKLYQDIEVLRIKIKNNCFSRTEGYEMLI